MAAGLGALVGLVLVVLLVWPVPTWFYRYVPDPKDRSAVEAATRTAMLAGLAGLAALGSLAVNARTYRIAQQGHITDRYTTAISQLGDAKLDVRLGGIYALERLAVDSRRDHSTVVEVLSAVVREHRRAKENEEATPEGDPPADVRAALTVLGRLPVREGVGRGGDMSGANLIGAYLEGANLTGVYLARVNLTNADLSGAAMSNVDLPEAHLSGARLAGVDLSGARLSRADLTDAVLSGADVTGANLSGADFTGADLVGADLSGAWLGEASLARADISEINLAGARNLTMEQLACARGEATRLPDGLRRPTA